MRTYSLGRRASEPKWSHVALSGQGFSFRGAPGSGQLFPGAQRADWPLHTCDQCFLSLPQEMIPFAVVGSDHEYQVNGKRILGRKTKWGTIEGNRQAVGASRQIRKLKLLLLAWSLGTKASAGCSWDLICCIAPLSHWEGAGGLSRAHSH